MNMLRILPKRVKVSIWHLFYGFVIALLLLASCVSLLRLSPYKTRGQNQYFRAEVVSIQLVDPGGIGPEQNVLVRLLDGPQKNQLISVTRSISFGDQAAKRLPIGSDVLLFKEKIEGNKYSYLSRWYMPGIATLFIILLALVIVLGAWRGITSVFGLSISIFILAYYVVPSVVNGHDAFTVCIEAAIAITLISLYIAHGLNRRTTIAFIGSMVTLAAIVGLTALASYVTGTSEVIDENNIGLLYSSHPIDIGGLLTGGVVIASLGTLYDVTTGQAAIVDEVHKTKRKLKTGELFWKGMSVGREHIAALINTLALVYVGVALPSIVTTIVLNQEAHFHAPLLVNLNTETVAEEVVRTSVASIGMLLALPITTWLAAYILPKWTPKVTKQMRRWFKDLW